MSIEIKSNEPHDTHEMGQSYLDDLRRLIDRLEDYNTTSARSRQISVTITHLETAELWLERSLFAKHETTGERELREAFDAVRGRGAQ